MAVSGHDGVNALNRRQRHRGVLHPVAVIGRADAGVRQRNNDVCAFLLHLRHIGAGAFDDVTRLHVAFQMFAVPVHHLRRHKSNQPDLDRVRFACAIGQFAIKDHIGRQQRLILARRSTGLFGNIGADHGEPGPGQRFHQERDPIVEFVIAQGRGIKAHGVHRRDDRVLVAFFHTALIGDVIAHRVALQEIPIVHQQRIGRLCADVIDQRCGAGKAQRIHRFVAIIIIRKHMHVQISGFHQAQVNLTRGSGNRKTDAVRSDPHYLPERTCGQFAKTSNSPEIFNILCPTRLNATGAILQMIEREDDIFAGKNRRL